jgi:hypothetical protein
VQLTYQLSRVLSTVAQYGYYQYHFSADTPLPPGQPPEFNRNAFRVGLALDMPIGRRAAASERP